jgi:hypothetical protein
MDISELVAMVRTPPLGMDLKVLVRVEEVSQSRRYVPGFVRATIPCLANT